MVTAKGNDFLVLAGVAGFFEDVGAVVTLGAVLAVVLSAVLSVALGDVADTAFDTTMASDFFDESGCMLSVIYSSYCAVYSKRFLKVTAKMKMCDVYVMFKLCLGYD
jgi:hypothetical protein